MNVDHPSDTQGAQSVMDKTPTSNKYRFEVSTPDPVKFTPESFACKTPSSFATPVSQKLKSFSMTPTPNLSKSFSASNSTQKKISRAEKFKEKNEQRYHWLLDIKDNQERSCHDPDYDPRTLYIPKSAWNHFTPFEKQFWEIKSMHWDTVVFFKKGKFYGKFQFIF